MKDIFPKEICRGGNDPISAAPIDEGVPIPALRPDIPAAGPLGEPAHSVAHAYLEYGAIAKEDFYDKLREAREKEAK